MKVLALLVLCLSLTACGRTLSQVKHAVGEIVSIVTEAYEEVKEDVKISKDTVVDLVTEGEPKEKQ